MKPIFTIHAGEYLVGSYIEQKFKGLNVWIPSKDTGIDLLITNKNNTKAVSIQVKFSKDFKVTYLDDIFQKGIKSCGWWSLNREKIKKSKAEFWVFVLHIFNKKEVQYIIMKPQELLKRLDILHGKKRIIQSYLWVTAKNRCWETRGLNKTNQLLISNNMFRDAKRDFTKYLNSWEPIRKKLK